MAIIYSYPLAEEVTNDSWVLGSEMENGLRVVKNYSMGDIAAFIEGGATAVPTLQDVTDAGANTTIQMQINGVDVATLDDIPDIPTQITKVLKTTVTEAQVLQLFTTPITILNSNNPLTVAYPINVYIKRNAGDAYTLVNNSFSVINDFGTTMTGNLNPSPLSNTSIGYFQSAITVSQNLAGGDKNVLYKLRANTGDPTLGTGSLDVYVTYIEIGID